MIIDSKADYNWFLMSTELRLIMHTVEIFSIVARHKKLALFGVRPSKHALLELDMVICNIK